MAELRRTTCNRDCPDACAIVATVEAGRVVRLQGDRNHPVTAGFLCHRTNRYLKTQYHPERLQRPLLRVDGTLQEVGWDRALDHIARELARIRDESGPEAVFHYRSGGTLGMVTAAASSAFFDAFGPVTAKRGDICSGAGEAAQTLDFGISQSSALDDLEHARHVLLWGKNVATSSPHTIPFLKRAQGRGAELVMIDPVVHRSSRLCDTCVQPRPGRDVELALAVGRALFDRGWVHPDAGIWCRDLDGFEALCRQRTVAAWAAAADVPEAAALDLARRLHEGPTTILVGWGMGRRLRGGTTVRALDALGAITGNVGVRGASVSFYFQRRSAFLPPSTVAPPRTISEPLFGPSILALDDPPVRAVWVTAGNPVAMLPESETTKRALESRELVVVVDSMLTDTARVATVVLPTTTLLEDDDLVGAYGHHHLGEVRPVVPAPEGVKSDLAIFQALAERLGIGDALAGSPRDWKDRQLRPALREAGVDLDALAGGVKNPLAPTIVFEGRRFETDDGLAHLLTTIGPPEDDDPARPLHLMSLSTPKSQCAQWADEPPDRLDVTVHPDAAGGLGDGAIARLESARGALEVRVRHDPRQRRDVAIVPKGGHLSRGACANALVTARLTDIGEGGALYDERVRLIPLN